MWFKFQLTRDLLCWFVPSSLSGSGMCEDAGDESPYAVCLLIDDNPEMLDTVDQKDSNVRDEAQSKRRKLMDELEIDIPELRKWLEGAEGAGSCAYACKAQTSARVDVPTAPMTLMYTIEHADDGRGWICQRRCSPRDFPFDCRWVQHARHHVRYGPERQQQQ